MILMDTDLLDPFSGSGTTPIVANLNKRKGVGIELNREYSLLSLEKAKNENINAELIEFQKIKFLFPQKKVLCP